MSLVAMQQEPEQSAGDRMAGDPSADPKGLTFGQRFRLRVAKNRLVAAAVVFLMLVVLMGVFAPYLTPYRPGQQNLLRRLQSPSRDHWFGTDESGRDVLTRIAYGTRVSLMIGVLGSFGGMVLGVTLGVVSGYYGGRLDNVVMRVVDVMMAFPGILLAILIVSILGPGMNNLIVALVIWGIPSFARVSRGSVLSIKEMDFVEAVRSLGASGSRIMTRHVVLNILSPIIVLTTLSVAGSILTAAGMGFLGLGVQPPTAEWGAMASTARHHVRDAPHLIMFPGFFIFFTVLSINILGDALRDVLDPRLKA